MKIGIFKGFSDSQTKQVVEACKDLGLDYELVDILSSDWIENVRSSGCEGFFCQSTCASIEKKQILDERYYFVSHLMGYPIYPNYLWLFIHENKRNMAAWLEYNGYPLTPTKVFTDKNEACSYFDRCEYPLVFKANLGSAASKVRIIKTRRMARKFAGKVFPKNGVWSLFNIGKIYSTNVHGIGIPDLSSPQKDYLIVQEYKDIAHEWRIIKIGNSYFGHQKLLKGRFASGSGRVGWVAPPKELLLLVKDICDKGGFPCMDVDIFETKNHEYFINELQASFGSYADSQMYIDGKPGRYRYVDGDFVFEEGLFNTFGSSRLKLEHFMEILGDKIAR